MTLPFLSIITINYNNANGLQKTIQSVVEQTYNDIEYIVVDGGSTDGSVEVIQTYQNSITKSVSEKDNGIYNAMNKGIAMATGNYLLFLNSGDVFTSKNTLQDCISQTNFKDDIIYGDYKFENGEKIYPDVISPYYFMRSSLPHQSTFFHQSVFEKMGVYDESYKICADRAFYLKCCVSNVFTWQHIKYPVTLFDLEGLSNNPNHLKMKQEEDERLWKEYLGVHYADYKKMFAQEQEINRLKKETINGIKNRILKKIKSLWKIR